jgi:hypothetical protein
LTHAGVIAGTRRNGLAFSRRTERKVKNNNHEAENYDVADVLADDRLAGHA